MVKYLYGGFYTYREATRDRHPEIGPPSVISNGPGSVSGQFCFFALKPNLTIYIKQKPNQTVYELSNPPHPLMLESTHTHTHTYIYIWIYSISWLVDESDALPAKLKEPLRSQGHFTPIRNIIFWSFSLESFCSFFCDHWHQLWLKVAVVLGHFPFPCIFLFFWSSLHTNAHMYIILPTSMYLCIFLSPQYMFVYQHLSFSLYKNTFMSLSLSMPILILDVCHKLSILEEASLTCTLLIINRVATIKVCLSQGHTYTP